tara:strand:- start:119 stop:949 length:831 start_codon:yes stop_codon:yes gene_type:complete
MIKLFIIGIVIILFVSFFMGLLSSILSLYLIWRKNNESEGQEGPLFGQGMSEEAIALRQQVAILHDSGLTPEQLHAARASSPQQVNPSYGSCTGTLTGEDLNVAMRQRISDICSSDERSILYEGWERNCRTNCSVLYSEIVPTLNDAFQETGAGWIPHATPASVIGYLDRSEIRAQEAEWGCDSDLSMESPHSCGWNWCEWGGLHVGTRTAENPGECSENKWNEQLAIFLRQPELHGNQMLEGICEYLPGCTFDVEACRDNPEYCMPSQHGGRGDR